MSFQKSWCLAILVGVLANFSESASAASAAKTLMVEHGRPIICVSQDAVLVLEFTKEPRSEAMMEYVPRAREHCRAKFRYRLYNRATDSETAGEGMVDENYRTVSRGATGDNVEDLGSHTRIAAGEFDIGWSMGTAGLRSWLYYRADSAIRFMQQPQQLGFDAMTHDLLKRYLASKNVEEFVSAGQTVKVMGPAVFSGDLPDETPVSARIDSCRFTSGAFEIGLTNLLVGKSYVIESSYELGRGNWNVVHTFVAGEAAHRWSDPLAKDISQAFYCIREGR